MPHTSTDRDMQELIARLTGIKPAAFQLDNSPEVFADAERHLKEVAAAFDAYILDFSLIVSRNSRKPLDMGCFTRVVQDGLEDAQGEIMNAREAEEECWQGGGDDNTEHRLTAIDLGVGKYNHAAW